MIGLYSVKLQLEKAPDVIVFQVAVKYLGFEII